MTSPKVYIINKSSHDFTDANRYGDPVFLTEGQLDRFNTNQMCRVINEGLKDSTPNDYILITSMTILCSLTCATFAHKHGVLNLLLFRNGKYIERKHDFRDPNAQATIQHLEKVFGDNIQPEDMGDV